MSKFCCNEVELRSIIKLSFSRDFFIFQVPVQRVTKYPLLLSRLHRSTAACATERDDVKAAQRCVECRLEEINAAAAAAAAAARDVPLWKRLAAARKTAHDLHVADIRLRKMAVDVLDWNHDDARFVCLLIVHF